MIDLCVEVDGVGELGDIGIGDFGDFGYCVDE